MSDQCVVLTGDNIERFRIKVIYTALKWQVRTGKQISRISAVAAARRAGFVGRTAKALLEDMEKKHPDFAS